MNGKKCKKAFDNAGFCPIALKQEGKDGKRKSCRKVILGQIVEKRHNLFTTKSFKQFRQGFQQESILLHRGNVENCVESVENPVESRGNNKYLLMIRYFLFVENLEKPTGNSRIHRGKVHLPCGKPGSGFYRKKV